MTSLIGEAPKPAELSRLTPAGFGLYAYRAETGLETDGLDTATVSVPMITASAAT
jgi:hypothetical protein